MSAPGLVLSLRPHLQHGATVLYNSLQVPNPEERPFITLYGFAAAVVPVLVLYYLMAVLVLLPGTRVYRLALLPFVAYLAFKAAIMYDYTAGYPTLNHLNYGTGVAMFVIVMRCIEWSTYNRPLERVRTFSELEQNVFKDAGNLLTNMRGIGWTWSKGLQIPRETRPLTSKTAFVLATTGWMLRDIIICDTLHYYIQSLSPDTFGSTNGGTIFDPNLPPVTRYLRSTFITALTGTVIYFSMTMEYAMATLISFAVPGLDNEPSHWPPFSEGPWKAASLADFWSRKWHQSFRRPFIEVGGKPLHRLFGPVGGVVGVFVLSGMLHDWSIWGMGKGTEFKELGGFFILNGIGLVLEKAWERRTGKRVGGLAGWLWAMVWLFSTGNLLADAWLSKGLAGCELLPEGLRPAKFVIQKWGSP